VKEPINETPDVQTPTLEETVKPEQETTPTAPEVDTTDETQSQDRVKEKDYSLLSKIVQTVIELLLKLFKQER
jgi:hypothetical protein